MQIKTIMTIPKGWSLLLYLVIILFIVALSEGN